jgi:hypothetical protein
MLIENCFPGRLELLFYNEEKEVVDEVGNICVFELLRGESPREKWGGACGSSYRALELFNLEWSVKEKQAHHCVPFMMSLFGLLDDQKPKKKDPKKQKDLKGINLFTHLLLPALQYQLYKAGMEE